MILSLLRRKPFSDGSRTTKSQSVDETALYFPLSSPPSFRYTTDRGSRLRYLGADDEGGAEAVGGLVEVGRQVEQDAKAGLDVRIEIGRRLQARRLQVQRQDVVEGVGRHQRRHQIQRRRRRLGESAGRGRAQVRVLGIALQPVLERFARLQLVRFVGVAHGQRHQRHQV